MTFLEATLIRSLCPKKKVHLQQLAELRPFRSTIAENPMLHANFTYDVLQNQSYCRSKIYIARIGIFCLFCSCELDLDPVTFIYKRDLYPLRYTGCVKTNFLPQGFRKSSYYQQTDKHPYATKIIYHAATRVAKNGNKMKQNEIRELTWQDGISSATRHRTQDQCLSRHNTACEDRSVQTPAHQSATHVYIESNN